MLITFTHLRNKQNRCHLTANGYHTYFVCFYLKINLLRLIKIYVDFLSFNITKITCYKKKPGGVKCNYTYTNVYNMYLINNTTYYTERRRTTDLYL